MKHFFWKIIIVFSITGLNAQDTDLLDKSFRNYSKMDRSKLSKFRRAFSLDWRYTFMLDFSISPIRTFELEEIQTGTIRVRDVRTTVLPTVASIGIEPRFNFFQQGKNALGLRLGTQFGLSASEDGPSGSGGLHIAQTVLVFYGRGFCGPSDNFSKYGFAINAGLISTIAPLFGDSSKREYFESTYRVVSGGNYFSKVFVLPAIQLDFYNNNPIKAKPTVTSLTAGYLNSGFMVRLNFGFPIL